jgi:tetratricopeptide (TPR) repeat protein
MLGEEHPDFAGSLTNLAAVLEEQGKYDEAQPLYRQTLAICRKVCAIHFVASYHNNSCQAFGEEHPDVTTSLNNLAGLLNVLGEYDESIQCLGNHSRSDARCGARNIRMWLNLSIT